VAVIVSVLTGGAAFQMFARLYVMALLAAGAQMLVNWHDSRSRRGQLPPRPTRRGLALEGEQDRRPGDDLTLCQARSGVCAHHVPGHMVSRRAWRSLAAGRDARRPANLQVTA
jgi:hypothetical protein